MSTRQLVLAIVASDKTFSLAQRGHQQLWSGKCLHCNARLLVNMAGQLQGHATIEHIVPRHHGGSSELQNLALACARCNHQKGRHLDHRRRDDPKLQAVVLALQARRSARWRSAAQHLGTHDP